MLVTGLIGAPPASAGPVTLASHTPVGVGTAPTGASTDAVTSADGAYVVFTSTAANLVSGQNDTNGATDIFLYQRSNGAVTLVSHAQGTTATAGNGASSLPVISADGAYVAFESTAKNLVTGGVDPKGTAGSDVFLYSRATGAISLVSHSTAGATTHGNDSSHHPSISADGAFVAFDSFATTLIAGTDPASTEDVFLFSRATGAVTLVSHNSTSATTAANNASSLPHISANGAFVTFGSAATNLVVGQSDAGAGTRDAFLYERVTGAVTLVSHVPFNAATTGNSVSDPQAISADGGVVVFVSQATNLVVAQNDPNFLFDIFVYVRSTGAVTLASRSAATPTTTANAGSHSPAVSADGAFVAFVSAASNLVTGQTDAGSDDDVFLFSRATGAVTLVSHTPASATTAGNFASRSPKLTADGSVVAFQSVATDLVPGQTDSNPGADVFLFARATGTVTLVSHVPASLVTTGNGASALPSISNDGSVVAFQSSATDLVSAQSDANASDDIFVHTPAGGGPRRPVADFDGDGDTDISVFRPSSNTWFVHNGATTPFGAAGDIPVPCDYDGNGTTDVAVFRPSIGGWLIQNQPSVFLGATGDVPVPADYDGDGDCDPAVFRPAVGGWYRVGNTTFHGLSGDIPVPADYDGNGIADITVFRPSVGGWYRLGASTVFFGLNGDIPVPADYDGNGTADVAVYRPAVGGWYVDGHATQFLGLSTDIPVPGDYDGNGAAERAVFRPASGAWYIGAAAPVFFGLDGDRPLPLPTAIRQVFFP
jgi:Tol biopolymer transport system component